MALVSQKIGTLQLPWRKENPYVEVKLLEENGNRSCPKYNVHISI